MDTSPIRTALPRSHDALRRHTRALSPQIDELIDSIATECGVSDIAALDALMFTVGDQETKVALAAYFQGDAHPILSMDMEDIRTLDLSLAKIIVTQSTVDADVNVQISDKAKKAERISSTSIRRG
jgi:hypothetical protein